MLYALSLSLSIHIDHHCSIHPPGVHVLSQHALYEVSRLQALSGLPRGKCPFCHAPVQRVEVAHVGETAAVSSNVDLGSKAEVFAKLRSANTTTFLQHEDFKQILACYVPAEVKKNADESKNVDLAAEMKSTLKGSGPTVQLLLGLSGRCEDHDTT
jgi:hypothetical protein